jgi:hypothetical protein
VREDSVSKSFINSKKLSLKLLFPNLKKVWNREIEGVL